MGKSCTTGMAQGVAEPRNIRSGDRRSRKKMPDKYKSLRDGFIAEYQKYKGGSMQDAVNYAEDRIKEIKAKERERRKMLTSGSSTTQAPQRKSKGGAVKKPAMAYGGMANKKQHMYSGGGQVKDNMKGLKKLAEKRPDVVRKMGYNV